MQHQLVPDSVPVPGLADQELMGSEGIEEREQVISLVGVKCDEGLPGRLRLTSVPQDGLGHITRPTIMEEPGVAIDCLGEANAPQRSGSPLGATRKEVRAAISETSAHVM